MKSWLIREHERSDVGLIVVLLCVLLRWCVAGFFSHCRGLVEWLGFLWASRWCFKVQAISNVAHGEAELAVQALECSFSWRCFSICSCCRGGVSRRSRLQWWCEAMPISQGKRCCAWVCIRGAPTRLRWSTDLHVAVAWRRW